MLGRTLGCALFFASTKPNFSLPAGKAPLPTRDWLSGGIRYAIGYRPNRSRRANFSLPGSSVRDCRGGHWPSARNCKAISEFSPGKQRIIAWRRCDFVKQNHADVVHRAANQKWPCLPGAGIPILTMRAPTSPNEIKRQTAIFHWELVLARMGTIWYDTQKNEDFLCGSGRGSV